MSIYFQFNDPLSLLLFWIRKNIQMFIEFVENYQFCFHIGPREALRGRYTLSLFIYLMSHLSNIIV